MSSTEPQSPNAQRDKSWIIGIIINDFTDPVYARIAERISQKMLEGDPHNCIVSSTKEDKMRERILASINVARLDGLFVVSSEENAEFYEQSQFSKVPIVFIDRTVLRRNTSMVWTEHVGSARTLTTHLLRQGHKKLACISSTPTYYTTTDDKLDGFRVAVQKYDAEEIRTEPVRFDHVDEDVHARLETFIQKKNIPDVLIAINCKVALSLLAALQKPQFDSLAKMKIACFEDCDQFNVAAIKVTSMSSPIEEISSTAVKLMVNAMGPKPVVDRIALNTTLIERR